MRKKNILVRGPALSQTGYGEQTRYALRSLRSREDLFEIFLHNIPWGKSNQIIENNEEKMWLWELMKKTHHHGENKGTYDVGLHVTIPNELQKIAPINILYTAGIESDRVAPEWLEKCNSLTDKIITISSFSKDIFEQTSYEGQTLHGTKIPYKLTTPIDYVSYPIKEFEEVPLDLKLETDFNFLCVSQHGPRKNFDNTIRLFLKEFQDDEQVGLVLKTFLVGNSHIDRFYTKARLEYILSEYPDRKCKIYLLHGYMDEKTMHSLYKHPQIKALMSFTHGEGFGLTMFEAAYSGLPVIAHDWGGQKDFLFMPKKNKKGKIKNKAFFSRVFYELKPIGADAVWDGVLQAESQWAYVNERSACHVLREVYENYQYAANAAKKLQKYLLKELAPEKQYKKFVDAMDLSNESENWMSEIEDIITHYD